MQVNSIVSSKGGVGKTTTSANLGGIAADAGLKTLLIDLDGQPTLSSYFPSTTKHRAAPLNFWCIASSSPSRSFLVPTSRSGHHPV